MSKLVASGATLRCSMGMAPSSLLVVRAFTVDDKALANVDDHVPMTHVMPFGQCRSTANPAVASATAAAMGVLTPMPCVPVLPSPWSAPSDHVTVDGAAALTTSSACDCQWAGKITVADPSNTLADDA